MRDGRTEGALGLGPLDVHVDPLVVTAEAGEGVDVLLSDLAPLAGPDLLAEEVAEPVHAVCRDLSHRRGRVAGKQERRAGARPSRKTDLTRSLTRRPPTGSRPDPAACTSGARHRPSRP